MLRKSAGARFQVAGPCWKLLATLALLPAVCSYAASAPTVASPATAAPNPVTGASTTLSVLGADQGGEANLTYTWSATGPASVTFGGNGTNTSKNTTATFQAVGSYTFLVSIQNIEGLIALSQTVVNVNPVVTRVAVNPSSVTVASLASQQFTATILDQFGNPATQPIVPTGWTDLSNTQLQSVCPPDNYGGMNYNFYTLCPNVINAWSGGIADTLRNRMVIWGGGHQNYSGNEVFALNLSTNQPAFTLLTEPSVFNPNNQVCPDANASDGTPVARETYNDLVYLPTIDRMFSFSGQKAPCGSDSGTTWTLDFTVSPPVWHPMDPVNGFNPVTVAANGAGSVTGAICAYDPNTDSVFCSWGNDYGLLQYTYQNNTWNLLAPIGSDIVPAASTAVVDPIRRLLIFIGNQADGVTLGVRAIDISGADPIYSAHDWTSQLSGCSGMSGNWPGAAYDPVLNAIVEWPGIGNTVYVFNPDTKTCVAQTFPNGPQNAAVNNGTFGRFAYFPALNAYVIVNAANLDAQMLSLDSTSLGWSVVGDGFISGSGSFTAGTTPGSVTISATVAGVTGTSSVTVVPAVSITSPASGSTVSGTATVSASANNAGVTGVQFQLDGANLGGVVTGSVGSFSYSWATSTSANGTHALGAIAYENSQNMGASAPLTVTVSNTMAPPPVSIWPSTVTPGTAWINSSAATLGLKFRSDVAGVINGIRFYKGAGNTGTHMGLLYSSTGTLLGQVTFTGETASGWQQVTLTPAVSIAANTTYIAALFSTSGFAFNSGYFTSAGVDNAPLHALQSSGSGGNGVYVYGSTPQYPNTTYGDANYWVDVVFAAANSSTVTIANPAGASPNPVTGTSTALSVLGADTAGESSINYTWSATGPGTVSFSANGTNAAKNTTATITAAGNYTLQAVLIG